VTGRRGRRRTKLLYDLKESTEYWTLKEEALDHICGGTGFGKELWTGHKTDN